MSTNSENIIQLNFTGFSTRVFLNEEKVSATDISLSVSENLISFEGAYGGAMNYGDNFRLNSPSFYELPEISCSIGTEITLPQIESLFFKWLENRAKPRTIKIGVGNYSNETFNFEECYFKSLKLSTSENNLVTANYDFFVLPREETIDNLTCNAKRLFYEDGIINDVPRLQNNKIKDFVFDMDSDNNDKIPVGYWETTIDGFGDDKKVLSWDLNINQNVITKYYCGRVDDADVTSPPLPDIMIGYPKMELSVSFLIDKNKFNEDIFATIKQNKKTVYDESSYDESGSDESGFLSLKIRGNEICKFKYGSVTQYTPSLSPNGAITFSATYVINQIQLLKNSLE